MKPISEFSNETLDLFLSENSEEFTDLYNKFMFRELNLYEFAGHVGVDISTLQRMIDLFTKNKTKC